VDVKSNSPLQEVPEDYCPAGADRWFEIPEGLDKGKKMFFFDHVEGEGNPKGTILFVHGNPECSYTYRHVLRELMTSGKTLRYVAMDHIGFGVSDQATYQMIFAHQAFNLRLLIKHLDLKNVTLVVHDWGGPIGVGAFVDAMDRVDKLVVLNTGVYPMPREGITYENWPLRWFPWCKFPTYTPTALWGGMSAWAVCYAKPEPMAWAFLKSNCYQILFLLRLLKKGSPVYVFSESLRTRANALSSKRHARETPTYGSGYVYSDPNVGPQSSFELFKNIHEAVPKHWGPEGRAIPAVGHFGSFDPLGKDSVIRQWEEVLPQMVGNTFKYPEVGHFVEEHKGSEIAQSILKLFA